MKHKEVMKEISGLTAKLLLGANIVAGVGGFASASVKDIPSIAFVRNAYTEFYQEDSALMRRIYDSAFLMLTPGRELGFELAHQISEVPREESRAYSVNKTEDYDNLIFVLPNKRKNSEEKL